MTNRQQEPHGKVEERYLDVLLEDACRPEPPANQLVEAVAARVDWIAPEPERRSGGTWIRVAAVLGGLGIPIAVAILPSDPNPSTAHSPAPIDAGHTQDVLPAPVPVRSVREIEALPVGTQNVRLLIFTPSAVRALTRLRNLRRLDASFTIPPESNPPQEDRPRFFPAAVEPLGQLTKLQILDLSGHGGVTGLDRLATLKDLRRLRINRAFIHQRTLRHLTRFPRLEDFELRWSSTVDPVNGLEDHYTIDMTSAARGLKNLAAIRSLRRLVLWPCSVDPAGIEALAALPRLEDLSLYTFLPKTAAHPEARGWPAKTFLPIARMRTLRKLSLNTEVDGKLGNALATLPLLEDLDIGALEGHEREVALAVGRMPRLRRLQTFLCDPIAFRGLSKSETLTDCFFNTCLGEPGYLVSLKTLPGLRRLTLYSVNAPEMQHLEDCSLEYVNVDDCDTISARHLLHLPVSTRELAVQAQQLDLPMLKRLENLRTLSLNKCDAERAEAAILALHESPIRRQLIRLTMAGDAARLRSMAKLTEFPALRWLDLRGMKRGALPLEVLAALRAKGVEVLSGIE